MGEANLLQINQTRGNRDLVINRRAGEELHIISAGGKLYIASGIKTEKDKKLMVK